jgi:mercuric ion transport protein
MNMVIEIEKSSSPLDKGRDVAKSVLAATGLLAAFGVASCCALPIALSLLGISAAGLVGIGYLAAQFQHELFYAATACLAGATFVMWRQRQARLCASRVAPANRLLDWGGKIALALAAGLLALTFWIEPPI